MTQFTGLGPLEKQIMKLAWAQRQLTARQVVDELSLDRKVAYTTIITVMTRLVEKGYLRTDGYSGKALIFRSAQTQGRAVKQLVKKILNSLVDQFGEEAVAAFVEESTVLRDQKSGTNKTKLKNR